MYAITCLLLAYLAVIAQLHGVADGPLGVHFPAIVLVLATAWFSPAVGAGWAFLLGLMLDALGTGPLGVHAATLIVLTALLPRMGFRADRPSLWQGTWAVFFVAWWDQAVAAAVESVPSQQWTPLEDRLLHAAAVAGLTTLVMGAYSFVMRRRSVPACG